MFNKTYKYRVILKCGASFKIRAEDLDLNFSDETGEITSYKFYEPRGEVPTHLPANEIVTILQEV